MDSSPASRAHSRAHAVDERSELAARLAARTLELVDIPSESRDEARIAEHVSEQMGALCPEAEETRVGNALIYTLRRGSRPFVILAGHLDTVPPQGNLPGRIEGGVVHGLGACDMKGSLAVLLELARWIARERPPLAFDLGLLFYDREEIPVKWSGLTPLLDECAWISEAGLCVLMEPTDGTLSLGSVGTLNAEVTFHGEAGHSARPWRGRNAIHAAVRGLARVAERGPVQVEVEGLVFHEVVSVTQIQGGVAQNVIPDRVQANVNYRYPPGMDPGLAEERLRSLLPPGADVHIFSHAASAPVARGPLVERLQRAGGLREEPKQGWTDAAQLAVRGVPAVNYGPGETRFAHRRDEQVRVSDLVECYQTLQRFVTET